MPEGSTRLHHAVHLLSYGLIAGFVWANRQVPYVWLAASAARST